MPDEVNEDRPPQMSIWWEIEFEWPKGPDSDEEVSEQDPKS